MVSFLKVGWFLALGLCGCQPAARPASPGADAPQAAVVPGTTGGLEDHIDAIDLAVGPGETLHLVWREVDRRKGGGLPGYRTLYARGDGGGASWTAPEVLPGSAGSTPRVFRGRGGVHVLLGRELIHLYRGDDGESWLPMGRIVPEGSLVVEASIPGFAYFGAAADAAAEGDGLAVAYLARHGAAGPLGLDFVSWSPGAAAAPRRLAEFPAAGPQQPAPRMLVLGERRHLLWAIGEEVREIIDKSSGPVERYSTRARLFYQSDDPEAGRQAPVEVTAGLSTPPQTIDDIELLATDAGLVALYSSRGLYFSRSGDGRAWSVPRRIAGFRQRSGSTGTDSWSLTAAGGAIAWIDERFQSSDRRWWKPLGGWPWSDDPEGVDNDVFLLPAGALKNAFAADGGEPLRQTARASYAFLVRLRASRQHLHLFWTGRRQSGKAAGAHPVPPEIFYRTLTLDGAVHNPP